MRQCGGDGDRLGRAFHDQRQLVDRLHPASQHATDLHARHTVVRGNLLPQAQRFGVGVWQQNRRTGGTQLRDAVADSLHQPRTKARQRCQASIPHGILELLQRLDPQPGVNAMNRRRTEPWNAQHLLQPFRCLLAQVVEKPRVSRRQQFIQYGLDVIGEVDTGDRLGQRTGGIRTELPGGCVEAGRCIQILAAKLPQRGDLGEHVGGGAGIHGA